MSIFLSIFAATCRPHNITGFLDNLKNTASDPSSFEVLLKLDEGADNMVSIIEDYKKTSPLNIRYLQTPTMDGYYSLDDGYNELLKIADPDTYFCWLLTDEIRFDTQGWDAILKKHIGFFPDDIFRIKLSIFQLKNYNDLFECLPCPDNYAVTTRKWLEIAGGWGNFWGPDSWHQCVDYYLGLCKNEQNPYGIWRSYPIFDIKVGGQEAGQGIEDPAKLKERVRKIWYGWLKHSSHKAQENFLCIAQRLNAHIVATSKNINRYILQDNKQLKTITLLPVEGSEAICKWSYHVPRIRFKFIVGSKKLKLVHIFPILMIQRERIIGSYLKGKLFLVNMKNRLRDNYRHYKQFIINSASAFKQSAKQLALRTFRRIIPSPLRKFIVPIIKIPYYIIKGMAVIISDVAALFNQFIFTLTKINLRKSATGFFTQTKRCYIFTYFYDGKKLTPLSPSATNNEEPIAMPTQQQTL